MALAEIKAAPGRERLGEQGKTLQLALHCRADRNKALSVPISPYSLTTTAVLAPSGLSSSARIRVVLPDPRKPVTAMTGSRGPRGRLRRRPKSGGSLPPKSDSGPASEVHLKRV